MKIIFWAPVHGQSRQSANLLAVALIMAMRKQQHMLLTQTQFRMNDLEDAIIGRTGVTELREQFYQDMGIDSLVRCIKRKRPEKTDVENCCIRLSQRPELMLLPGSRSNNYEIYCQTFNEMITAVLAEAEKYFDAVLVDSNPGMDPINRKLFCEADMVVVNFSQNIGVIDSFFKEKIKELSGKNVFYLFGSYLPDSRYSLKNLRLRYKELNKRNTGVIPLSVGFMDAISEGRIPDFFEENLESEQGDANYMFIREVIATTDRLCNLLDEINLMNNGKSERKKRMDGSIRE